jgi:hypothetical protein
MNYNRGERNETKRLIKILLIFRQDTQNAIYSIAGFAPKTGQNADCRFSFDAWVCFNIMKNNLKFQMNFNLKPSKEDNFIRRINENNYTADPIRT